MLQFKQFIIERIISIGINPEHEKFREQHRTEIHNLLRNAYKDIGGYGGHVHGSKAESDAIHKDIDNSMIKATKRDGKITAVNLYKKQFGRKSIAVATDGTQQGKQDFLKTKIEDNEFKRAWGEVSGKSETIARKINTPIISSSRAQELLNKNVTRHDDSEHYTREIGGQPHRKIMVGYPKI